MEHEKRGWAVQFAPAWVACVWLPRFAVRTEQARRPDLAGAPLVLVGGTGDREGVVRAGSQEAEAAGLLPGTPAQAIPQKCPGAVLLPFDSRYYGDRYRELLLALDAVTPAIEVQPFEAFYLDLGEARSAAREAQTPDAEQVARAVCAVLPAEYSPRIGIASGKFTAWVAAHQATPIRPIAVSDEERRVFLREAPSSLLPVEPETARKLHLLGLRTLGRIARLPRSAMLAQFGWEGERAHRLACGEDREPLTPYRPPLVVRETLEFPDHAPTVAHFHMALYSLLERLWRRPERHNTAVRQVRLEAVLESGEVWERAVTLRRPHEQWHEAYAELRRRLEPVRPVGVLLELSVELTAFAERVDAQRLLFPNEAQDRRERLLHELEQLQARLGRSGVYRIVEVEPWSRLPERRHALLSYEG